MSRDKLDVALREMAAAHHAWRRAWTANARVSPDHIVTGFPMKEFRRLEDAKYAVVEIAANLYPEYPEAS